jgi:hypothetical protein
VTLSREVHGGRGLLVLFAVVVVGSFPATWLLILFLGNVGVNVGIWGALPAGILLTFFVAGTGGLSRYGR